MRKNPVLAETLPDESLDSCDVMCQHAEKGVFEFDALYHENLPGRKLPETVLPGLTSVGYWNAHRDLSWGKTWHRHNAVEFNYLESGTLTIPFKDAPDVSAKPGDLIIMRPWQLHGYGAPHITANRLHWAIIDTSNYWPNQQWKFPDWVILANEDKTRLYEFLRLNETAVLSTDKNVQNNFIALSKAVDDYNQNSYSALAILLNELLYNILLLIQSGKFTLNQNFSSSQHVVKLFLDTLVDSPEELQKPWSIRQMANECGIGLTLFNSVCRQYTNMSPAEFLKSARLNLAKNMLTHELNAPIKEIALNCGFGSASYFTQLFTAEMGMTPFKFREIEKVNI